MAEALVSFRGLLKHMDISEVLQMPSTNTPSSAGSSQS